MIELDKLIYARYFLTELIAECMKTHMRMDCSNWQWISELADNSTGMAEGTSTAAKGAVAQVVRLSVKEEVAQLLVWASRLANSVTLEPVRKELQDKWQVLGLVGSYEPYQNSHFVMPLIRAAPTSERDGRGEWVWRLKNKIHSVNILVFLVIGNNPNDPKYPNHPNNS